MRVARDRAGVALGQRARPGPQRAAGAGRDRDRGRPAPRPGRDASALSVVPTVVRSGDAFNVVPADGELIFDMRADSQRGVRGRARGASRASSTASRSRPRWSACGRGWTRARPPRGLLERAGARLGRPIVGVSRGGASDASHFAASIPLTVDGLGPRGGGAHTPGGVRARAIAAASAPRWRWRWRPRCWRTRILSRAFRSPALGTCDPYARERLDTAASRPPSPPGPDPARGPDVLGGIVAMMWLVEAINTLDSNRARQATGSTPATSTTSGRSSPRRSCTSASST